MSDVWSDPSSTSILYVCKQRRLWRECADAKARLSLRWSTVGSITPGWLPGGIQPFLVFRMCCKVLYAKTAFVLKSALHLAKRFLTFLINNRRLTQPTTEFSNYSAAIIGCVSLLLLTMPKKKKKQNLWAPFCRHRHKYTTVTMLTINRI